MFLQIPPLFFAEGGGGGASVVISPDNFDRPTTYVFNFLGNRIGDQGCQFLGDVLADTQIEHLILGANNITEKGNFTFFKSTSKFKCKAIRSLEK